MSDPKDVQAEVDIFPANPPASETSPYPRDKQKTNSIQPTSLQAASISVPRKKTSSFQITSVQITMGSRLSNDGADDSADDLDESHMDDLQDQSKSAESDDAFSAGSRLSVHRASPGTAEKDSIVVMNSGVTNVTVVDTSHAGTVTVAHQGDIAQWQNRFRVVKIETSEPFRRGRWVCMDFLDPPTTSVTSQSDPSEKGRAEASSSQRESFGDSQSLQQVIVDIANRAPIPYSNAPLDPQIHHAHTYSIPDFSNQNYSFGGGPAPQSYPTNQVAPCEHVTDRLPDVVPDLTQNANALTTQDLNLGVELFSLSNQVQGSTLTGSHEYLNQPVSDSGGYSVNSGEGYAQQGGAGVQHELHGSQQSYVATQAEFQIGHVNGGVHGGNQAATAVHQVHNGASTNESFSTQIPPPTANATQTQQQQPTEYLQLTQPASVVQDQNQQTNNHQYAAQGSQTSQTQPVYQLTVTNEGEGTAGAGGSETPVPPVKAGDGDDSDSAGGASAVAIDNKIEQAMDLVKSHLMFAVREEVDVLKERITELMDRISQLEYENTFLKANATPDTLTQLAAASTQFASSKNASSANGSAQAQPPPATSAAVGSSPAVQALPLNSQAMAALQAAVTNTSSNQNQPAL